LDKSPQKELVSNSQIAMIIFIAAELMFFSGLISTFLVFRFSGEPWPPPFQPRFPIPLTAINTVLLTISSFTMWQTQKKIKQKSNFLSSFSITIFLGITFLLIQGFEWIKMLNFGLSAKTTPYGSTFYVIIGTHAAHVLGAVIWLFLLFLKVLIKKPENLTDSNVSLCAMYWHMVVGLWPILFILVYLI
tara:strand:+ start:92 stop:658 length:567 start_codon:yes stop_codon:yes gene_type:complete